MLAVKAKHATMLLTVSDAHGLPAELQDEVGGEVRKSAVTVRSLNPFYQRTRSGFLLHQLTRDPAPLLPDDGGPLSHSAVSG